MIYFRPSETWKKFGETYKADPERIVIDLRPCKECHEYVLAIEDKLHASEDNTIRLKTGKSLDAFISVLWDYFFENWLKSPKIYVVGWKGFIDKHPVFSQRLLSAIYDAHRNVVWGQARSIYQGEDKVEDLKIHEEIQNGVKIFLILN